MWRVTHRPEFSVAPPQAEWHGKGVPAPKLALSRACIAVDAHVVFCGGDPD